MNNKFKSKDCSFTQILARANLQGISDTKKGGQSKSLTHLNRVRATSITDRNNSIEMSNLSN